MIAKQIMVPFPAIKPKQPIKAFSKVSVDYGGPFISIHGRRRKNANRFLSLFKCLLLCAMHLEMAYTLHTDSFLKEFCRMTSHRGFPQEVMSDNGTNFAGATQNLKNWSSN